MTVNEYHAALTCKIQGTWNLHNAALELGLKLDFFTMLSSISSVLGAKAQANYVAANSFLDAFAAYRQRLGLPACTINLGIVESVGYMTTHKELFKRNENDFLVHLNNQLLENITKLSILQQGKEPINPESISQMVTGFAVPQPAASPLVNDARFDALFVKRNTENDVRGPNSSSSKDSSQEVKELNQLLRAKKESSVVLDATVTVVGNYLSRILRLTESPEPERPLSTYGIDSLAMVEFRNWIRAELGAGLAMLDMTSAPSLIALCQVILSKVTG